MNETTQSTLNQDDVAYGYKVIEYALNTLAWGVTVAVAWSCSTLLMGVVMFIIMSIVMALLLKLAELIIWFKMPATSVESLGRNVGGTAARVTNLFTRKVPA